MLASIHESHFLAEARLLEVAMVLIERRQLAGLLELALAELGQQYPGTSWVILERRSRQCYRAVSLVGINRRDASSLVRQACETATTVDLDSVVSAITPFPRTPVWCGWPRTRTPDLVLAVWSDGDVEQPGVAEVAAALHLIANAHAAAKEFHELSEQNKVDPLTNILNRRAILELVVKEQLRGKRYGFPLSVLYLDIDHFKQINDTYSHEIGDHALAALAETLRGTIRESDAAGRVGGDEFLVVLPHTNSRVARRVAQAIQSGVAAMRVTVDQTELRLGVTIGTACTDEGRTTDLVNLADRRMLNGKRQRNHTAAASSNGRPSDPVHRVLVRAG